MYFISLFIGKNSSFKTAILPCGNLCVLSRFLKACDSSLYRVEVKWTEKTIQELLATDQIEGLVSALFSVFDFTFSNNLSLTLATIIVLSKGFSNWKVFVVCFPQIMEFERNLFYLCKLDYLVIISYHISEKF